MARTLERGPVQLGRLVEVGVHIADALAAAHAAGVVHRDLKPGNVMLTRDGRVKILDFGLARQDRVPGVDSTTMAVSQPGVILGTPRYMSPEQVRGEPVDARSDLFSLGVILYEMASGKPPFRGTSSVEVMSAILKDEPPELPPPMQPALDRIVRRCLEKEPDLRFQRSADLAAALKSLFALPAQAARPRSHKAIWAAAAALTAITVGAISFWAKRPPPPRIIDWVQITNDVRGNGAPMLTDGTRLSSTLLDELHKFCYAVANRLRYPCR